MPDYGYSCRSIPLSETSCEKGNNHTQAVRTAAGLHASTARIRDTPHAEQPLHGGTEGTALRSGNEDSLQVENSRLSEKINSLQLHINDYSSKLDKARREADKFRNLSEENLYLKQRERVLTDYVVDNDRLVKELREKCRILEAGEWETLEQMCESTYSNFVSRLLGVCPTLTKQELHLCMLIKLRFNNAQMSEIFGVNTTSVSQKKFRLKKHLSDTLQDGLPDEMTLDRWVAEF